MGRRDQPPLSLLVAAWWSSAVVAVMTSKVCLSNGLDPLHLFVFQFEISTLLLWLLLWLNHMPRELTGEVWLVYKVAGSYAAAFVCTNLAFSLSSTPFVEAVKAGEPLTTCLLSALWLGQIERGATYLSLVPIMLGVFLVSYSAEGEFRRDALLATLASNVGFSARAVLAKQLRQDFPQSCCAKSDLVLFYHVSLYGLLFLLPLVVLRDGYSALSGLPVFGVQLDSNLSTAALMSVAALNGVCFAVYNGASFAVLSHVSANSHAALNLLRRVVIICTSALFFSVQIRAVHAAGIALALAGGLLHARVRLRAAAAADYLQLANFDKLRVV